MHANNVILLGKLGADPLSKTSSNGKNYTYLSVATNKKLKDGKVDTRWHSIFTWGSLATACAKVLKKGSPVYVEGEIQYKQVILDNGKNSQTCTITARTVQFLGSRESNPDNIGNRQPEPDNSQWGGTNFNNQQGFGNDIPF